MLGFRMFIVMLSLFFSAFCGAQDTPEVTGGSMESMVKRINERYDDFFNYHRSQEERWQRMQAGVDERKTRERQDRERMERAREEYIKARRPRASDEGLRLEWEARQKERAAELEMLRRRYVEKRDTLEQYLKKGRQIPGLKEFDLEDM